MQQRRLRLGDILDDYCPRERRLTNHAVVAMIDDEIRQTRCTTCDAEHEFKQGKMPTLRRKKDSVAAAYKEVLAAVTSEAPVQAVASTAREEIPAAEGAPQSFEPSVPPPAPDAEPLAAAGDPEGLENEAPGDTDESEAGRVHRRLIRATLPRAENHQVTRPVPEFTMRQPAGRAGKFRGGAARGMGSRPGGGRAAGSANGNSRTPMFGRPGGSRGGGGGQAGRVAGRNETHRQPRGGQQARHGKKHSK